MIAARIQSVKCSHLCAPVDQTLAFPIWVPAPLDHVCERRTEQNELRVKSQRKGGPLQSLGKSGRQPRRSSHVPVRALQCVLNEKAARDRGDGWFFSFTHDISKAG